MSFITIATFPDYFKAAPAKSLLENEGIICYLKDEHQVTMLPAYGNMIGGIKLDIDTREFNRARQILLDHGYTVIDYKERNKPVSYKKSFPLFIAAILATVIFIWITVPFDGEIDTASISSNYDKLKLESLITGEWCVTVIKHNDSILSLKTITAKKSKNQCNESLIMSNNHMILPGFNTAPIQASYIHNDTGKTMLILNSGMFEDVYCGEYNIEEKFNQLILTSQKTTIYCVRPSLDVETPDTVQPILQMPEK